MASARFSRILHVRCRGLRYPGSDVERFPVPDEIVRWEQDFPGYKPVFYESPTLAGKPWADPGSTLSLSFNQLDGQVNRKSHCGEYKIINGFPINPYGRTGIIGRGLLGRWGPNHAADPIVSRWKRTKSGDVICHPESAMRILQICIIKRNDCGEFALPGGMVDPGENVSQTLKREFTEEALNSANSEEAQKLIDSFFRPENGVEVYRDYVDDPRNTDNSWMETVAVNFHDATGDQVGRFKLSAGDDAAHVQWMDIGSDLNLYANHREFIASVVKLLGAHW